MNARYVRIANSSVFVLMPLLTINYVVSDRPTVYDSEKKGQE
jgi:hypothetical protein